MSADAWSPRLSFCDAWDRDLAENGPAAIFLIDPDGELRLSADRSRDAWRHAPGPHEKAPCHCLMRDGATGHVHYVLSTSPTLVLKHPRLQATRYPDQDAALAALAALGRPALSAG